ncbi:MAG: energy transducer TonB [Spirochaetia bacterium]|nr:energy transducer TonB [Spirochaetia bacterium]
MLEATHQPAGPAGSAWVAAIKDRLSSFFGISLGIHLLLAGAMYIYLYAWSEPEHYVATVAMYMGDADVDRETTGKGQGNKDADKNKKPSSETGTGPSSNAPDWGTASDPSIEGGSRYAPDIWIDGTLEDLYPARAKQANLGRVTVAVTLLIDSNGRIVKSKVRYVRSPGNAHKPFEGDFIVAANEVATKRMRLRSSGYKKGGKPVDFIWDTTINFTLQ